MVFLLELVHIYLVQVTMVRGFNFFGTSFRYFDHRRTSVIITPYWHTI